MNLLVLQFLIICAQLAKPMAVSIGEEDFREDDFPHQTSETHSAADAIMIKMLQEQWTFL